MTSFRQVFAPTLFHSTTYQFRKFSFLYNASIRQLHLAKDFQKIKKYTKSLIKALLRYSRFCAHHTEQLPINNRDKEKFIFYISYYIIYMVYLRH